MQRTAGKPSRRSGSRVLAWDFPLPRTHTGIVLGNGVQGLMVWGADRISITVGRAGFWDHRGGNPFAARTTYAEVRRLLEAGDERNLRAAFSVPARRPGDPAHPQQYGCGRLDLRFDGFTPLAGRLRLDDASVRIDLASPSGARAALVVRQAMDEEIAWVELDAALAAALSVDTRPAWEFYGDTLAAAGCAPPARWDGRESGGFCQSLPEDQPVAMAWRKRGRTLRIATALGEAAGDRARRLAETPPAFIAAARRRAAAWWQAYWADTPRLALPDAAVQRAWDYGLYKQAGLTTPGGLPAALQGAWMEEYQPPPWSNDYHFNINVQMVYLPALPTNRASHLKPMWDLLREWFPRLLRTGEAFFGTEGAMMLPHAVDDRCQVVGTFWAGTIDQACAAWMAQIAWLHYRYTLDDGVLRGIAWPLLNGAFNGYWAMLEEIDDGSGRKRLSLPVSVSPEYNGSNMDAWGRDASFQLAALHATAAVLPQAARAIGEPIDPRWAEVSARLPPYTLIQGCRFPHIEQGPHIGLWEGQDLDVSHRHHSHLAAVFPFRTVDPFDPAHAAVVRESFRHWLRAGAGGWTGWCVPWTAALCARYNLADAAVSWLHWWDDVFTNVGHGTLHDADFAGCGVFDAGRLAGNFARRGGEVMQMDAAMGALTAIAELLVQCRGDRIHVLPAIPRRWRSFAFDGIRTEGAFLVGATVNGGRTVEVRVRSLAGQPLRLAHGLGSAYDLDGQPRGGDVLETATSREQVLVLRAVSARAGR